MTSPAAPIWRTRSPPHPPRSGGEMRGAQRPGARPTAVTEVRSTAADEHARRSRCAPRKGHRGLRLGREPPAVAAHQRPPPRRPPPPRSIDRLIPMLGYQSGSPSEVPDRPLPARVGIAGVSGLSRNQHWSLDWLADWIANWCPLTIVGTLQASAGSQQVKDRVVGSRFSHGECRGEGADGTGRLAFQTSNIVGTGL